MKRARAILILFLLLACALLVGAVFRYPLVLDDPFITYRYARNLIEGHGMVFNPGEHVLSTTTPLYALVRAAQLLLAYRFGAPTDPPAVDPAQVIEKFFADFVPSAEGSFDDWLARLEASLAASNPPALPPPPKS